MTSARNIDSDTGKFEAILALSRNDDQHKQSSVLEAMDRRIGRYLLYPEDAVFIRNFLWVAITCLFGLYANFCFSWNYVNIFTVAILLNGQAIGRFVHITSHRKIFRKEVGWLNQLPVWILSPWFGDPPYLYATEHIVNHHAFDNSPRDISSTLTYQRDSLRDLMLYLLNFFFGTGGIFGMLSLFRQNRGGRVWRNRFFWGQLIFWGIVFVRLWQDWVATSVLLIAPFVTLQAINRLNNWTEHAFINEDCPLDPLGNSYTILNSRSNAGIGGNEGYHGTHHMKPGLPNHLWPQHFRDHIQEYYATDHLVFQDTSTFGLFIMLIFKNYRAMARHYVQFPGRQRTEEEVIALLKRRVKSLKA